MDSQTLIKNKIEELRAVMAPQIPVDATQEEKSQLDDAINGKLSSLFLNDLLALCDKKLQEQNRGEEFDNLIQELAQIGNLTMKDMIADPQENFKNVFVNFNLNISEEEVTQIYLNSCDKIIDSIQTN